MHKIYLLTLFRDRMDKTQCVSSPVPILLDSLLYFGTVLLTITTTCSFDHPISDGDIYTLQYIGAFPKKQVFRGNNE